MLIPLSDLCRTYTLELNGVLHLGAHRCEERAAYHQAGISDARIHWVDANRTLVDWNRAQGVPNVYHGVLAAETGKWVDFIETNNGESSSVYELAEHRVEYPGIREIARHRVQTTTVHDLLRGHGVPVGSFNFVNLDLQGAELDALRGFGAYLAPVQYIYTEFCSRPLYADAALRPELHAFLEEAGFREVQSREVRQGWGDAFYMRTYE